MDLPFVFCNNDSCRQSTGGHPNDHYDVPPDTITTDRFVYEKWIEQARTLTS